MPTRFPKSLNLYNDRNSLAFAPTPHPNLSGWAVWCEDFHPTYIGWTALADSTGTAGLYATASNGSIYGLGNAYLLTANTDTDKVTIWPTPASANTLANTWPSASTEWIMAAAVTLQTSANQGFACGGATATTINNAGTAGDMTSATPTNGIYFRKAVSSSAIEFVYTRASSATATTILAAASVASATRYKLVVRYKGGTAWCYVNDAPVATVTGLTTLGVNGLAPFIQAEQSGTGGAQTLICDYLYWATKQMSQATTANANGVNGRF